MTDASSRRRALEILDVGPRASSSEVKRSYRRLARRHHPDVGGDPGTFQAVRWAVEVLLESPPAQPTVARGRPSRAATSPLVADPSAVDWDVEPCRAGDRLAPDRLAVRIATRPDHAIVAVSRAPSSPLNRVAVHLADDLTARLRIGPAHDDRGVAVVETAVSAVPRAARRPLDRIQPPVGWLRRRSPARTTLSTSMPRDQEPQALAASTVAALYELLADLDWRLESWTVIDESSR